MNAENGIASYKGEYQKKIFFLKRISVQLKLGNVSFFSIVQG